MVRNIHKLIDNESEEEQTQQYVKHFAEITKTFIIKNLNSETRL